MALKSSPPWPPSNKTAQGGVQGHGCHLVSGQLAAAGPHGGAGVPVCALLPTADADGVGLRGRTPPPRMRSGCRCGYQTAEWCQGSS